MDRLITVAVCVKYIAVNISSSCLVVGAMLHQHVIFGHMIIAHI